MSKTQLKKTLAGMTASQISEMVLELYEARPEAKEYLDFFVSPDIGRKLDKAKSLIKKEVSRNSRGRNKSRPTKIRRYIKDISSLNPGPEPIAEIMTFSIETICKMGSDQYIKQSTQAGFARLLHDIILFVDSTGQFGEYLPRIEAAVESMDSSSWRGGEFKKIMEEELRQTVECYEKNVRHTQ